nr:PREDICTED: anther-specific proline-rich protein APG-like isoform X4 [Tribolium castaneum]|eukprot:XP_008195903.1 PREDICTED: anther-specific proline-rich protein APG-like isoform X4 [Tribolium castaneum]
MTLKYDEGFGALGVFIVIFFIFIIMLILQCCLGSRTTKKVIKGRKRFGGSYEEIRRRAPHFERARSVAPATAPLETILDTDIDGIVVIPEPNQGSSVVVPPYPVEARHPTPENKSVPAPGPGFATYNPPYPTHNPHPVPVDVDYCAPLPIGISPAPYPPPGPTPYPPAGPPNSAPYPSYPGHDSQPPSYSEAVGQPSAQPLIPKEGYTKQAPYNPNY